MNDDVPSIDVDKDEEEFDEEYDELTGIVDAVLDMWWVIEIFDHVMDPPLLYGPHNDAIQAMQILDIMLTTMNNDGEMFSGRIRPLFVPEGPAT
jgi:hypothetical protein